MTAQCKLCSKDINPHDVSSWKEVTGFVGGPKKDSMVLRTDTGEYACTPCIEKAKQGQAPDQESLFDPIPTGGPPSSTPELDRFYGQELGIGDE